MKNSNSNLDDLIGSGQPIIVQEGGSDKKFIYTLLIILVILFILALGLIAYLGSKYFNKSGVQPVAQAQTQMVQKVDKPIVKEVVQPTKEVEQKVAASKQENGNISKLEAVLQEQEQPKVAPQPQESSMGSTIQKVASASGAKKGLSQEEIAKIAQLVAQELAKSQAKKQQNTSSVTQSSSSSSASVSSDDASLAKALESASADTLKEEKIDVSKINNGGNVQAKGNAKKVDTFNKVVVQENSNSNDELSKLASEIDSILASQDAQKGTTEVANKEEYNKEITTREKEMRYIVVKKGDTLSSIAYKAYGRASAYMKIYKANPDLVKNPNRIYIGMKLRVPMDEEYKAFNKR